MANFCFQSLVGKLVSGLISNTPLSKWFGKDTSVVKSVVRRREEDDDDESDNSYGFRPPVKRAKIPSSDANTYSVFESPVTVHNASNNVNNVPSSVYSRFPEPVAGPSGLKARKVLLEKHNSTATTLTLSSDSFNKQEIISSDKDSDSEESKESSTRIFGELRINLILD